MLIKHLEEEPGRVEGGAWWSGVCFCGRGRGSGEGGWSKETSLQFFLAWVPTSPGIRSLRCMVRYSGVVARCSQNRFTSLLATSKNKGATHAYTSFFKPETKKKARFTSNFTLKLWNDLTIKWNDLTWNKSAQSSLHWKKRWQVHIDLTQPNVKFSNNDCWLRTTGSYPCTV